MLGWIANGLLIVCAGFVHKYRWALLFGVLGSFIWALEAVNREMWDLLFIEIVLGSLQMRGYLKWQRD